MPAVMRANSRLVISMASLRVGQQGEVAVHDWDGLVTGGEAHVEEAKARGLSMTREDLACLIYTSGTGGAPRGVMQHHGAILHNGAGAAQTLVHDFGIGANEIGRASGRESVCQYVLISWVALTLQKTT